MDLSVVIPTLNAAAHLPATLTAIGDGPEIIVVDGGSTDGTRDAAPHLRVISAVRGRGSQIAAGSSGAGHPDRLATPDDLLRLEQRVVAAHGRGPGPTPATSASISTPPIRGPVGWSGSWHGAAASSGCRMAIRGC